LRKEEILAQCKGWLNLPQRDALKANVAELEAVFAELV